MHAEFTSVPVPRCVCAPGHSRAHACACVWVCNNHMSSILVTSIYSTSPPVETRLTVPPVSNSGELHVEPKLVHNMFGVYHFQISCSLHPSVCFESLLEKHPYQFSFFHLVRSRASHNDLQPSTDFRSWDASPGALGTQIFKLLMLTHIFKFHMACRAGKAQ
jgi:hypothetical protein